MSYDGKEGATPEEFMNRITDVGQKANEEGYYNIYGASGGKITGTLPKGQADMASYMGLSNKELGTGTSKSDPNYVENYKKIAQSVEEELKSGSGVVVTVEESQFSKVPHAILLVGYEEGKTYVLDPYLHNSQNSANTNIDPQNPELQLYDVKEVIGDLADGGIALAVWEEKYKDKTKDLSKVSIEAKIKDKDK